MLRRKLLMTSSFKEDWTKHSTAGNQFENPTRQTHMIGTDSRRIFPDMHYCCLVWNVRWEQNRADGEIPLNQSLDIAIRRDSGVIETSWRTVLVKPQNRRVIPRSRTCNLSITTMRYKLHGWDPRPSKRDNDSGKPWALWAIKCFQSTDYSDAGI